MAANEIHVADVGTVFTITVQDGDDVVNISTATLKQIIFQKPDDTTLTKTASFVTDGSDGQIKYTIIAGDLDVPGRWRIAAYIEMPSGKWHTDITTFQVYENLT